jgi:hypothetical protein
MCALLLHGALLFGQTAPAKASPPKRTFATERGKVAFLAGSFRTVVTIPPSSAFPQGATGSGSSTVTWALDSMFLSIDEQSQNSVLGRYHGYGMLGFDVPTQQFVLSMFNNYGDRPTYHGEMAGDTLVLQTKVPSPRGTFDQKLLWYRDGGTVRLKVLNDMGKGYIQVLEESAEPALTPAR